MRVLDLILCKYKQGGLQNLTINLKKLDLSKERVDDLPKYQFAYGTSK
jgi:hypothetical protein